MVMNYREMQNKFYSFVNRTQGEVLSGFRRLLVNGLVGLGVVNQEAVEVLKQHPQVILVLDYEQDRFLAAARLAAQLSAEVSPREMLEVVGADAEITALSKKIAKAKGKLSPGQRMALWELEAEAMEEITK